MAIIGSGTTVNYSVEQDPITASGNYDAVTGDLVSVNIIRRQVERLTIAAEFTGAALTVQQFSTPSGYRLSSINSDVTPPAMANGKHQEVFEKIGNWTTSTTSTTSTTTTTT